MILSDSLERVHVPSATSVAQDQLEVREIRAVALAAVHHIPIVEEAIGASLTRSEATREQLKNQCWVLDRGWCVNGLTRLHIVSSSAISVSGLSKAVKLSFASTNAKRLALRVAPNYDRRLLLSIPSAYSSYKLVIRVFMRERSDALLALRQRSTKRAGERESAPLLSLRELVLSSHL